MDIDIATIEKGAEYLGMVASIPQMINSLTGKASMKETFWSLLLLLRARECFSMETILQVFRGI